MYPDLQRAVDFTLLHQVPPHHALLPFPSFSLAFNIHILRQIQLDLSESAFIALPTPCGTIGRIILENLELDQGLLEKGRFVNCEAHRNGFYVVPSYTVGGNGRTFGASTVFGGGRRGQMPFDVGGARGEGDIIQVVDLGAVSLGS